MSVPIAMIAAVAENGVIGSDNAIPWRLSSDFAHFKRMTLGKPLIMGRKTFESIGKPLEGRTSIVVSRKADYRIDGVAVVSSLGEALELAQDVARRDGAGEVMIGGGATIYADAMPLADRLYISHVTLKPEGDTYFPQILPQDWRESGIIEVPQSPRDSATFTVRVYERLAPARR